MPSGLLSWIEIRLNYTALKRGAGRRPRRGPRVRAPARSAAAGGLPSPLNLSTKDRECAKTGVCAGFFRGLLQ